MPDVSRAPSAQPSTPAAPPRTPAERLAAAEVAAHAAASHIRAAKPTDSDPDQDEALRRARQPRTLTSYHRPDTRRVMAQFLGR